MQDSYAYPDRADNRARSCFRWPWGLSGGVALPCSEFDPRHLTVAAALDALGLGFFSIGVGSRLDDHLRGLRRGRYRSAQVAIITIVGDTAVSLAAGLAIFPIVFAEGLDPASGPGLMFVTLPLAFARIPGGDYAALGFFLLLIVAALASGISMLEMAVAAP